MDISGMMRTPYQTYGKNSNESSTSSATRKTGFATALENYGEELAEKIKNGETEPTYQIGGKSYTVKEWDKLISHVDDAMDTIREEMRERIKKLATEEEKEQDMNRETEREMIQKITQDTIQDTTQDIKYEEEQEHR